MLRLTLAVALVALPVAAAPVPKAKPRDGLILLLSGYGGEPVRLFHPDGKVAAELPFRDACSASVSPDGQRVAVVTRKFVHIQRNQGPDRAYSVYLVPITTTDAEARGEPLVTGAEHPALAWTPDGKSLYVSHSSPRPGAAGTTGLNG